MKIGKSTDKPHKSKERLHHGPKRYRLTFTNENTFNTVWSVKLSRFRVWLLAIAALAAIVGVLALLFLGTPLSALLPGYLKPEERHNHVSNTLRIDSLQDVMDTRNLYMANLQAILTDGISPDSIRTADSLATVTDTLIATSKKEQAFTRAWEERERYNLSVVTPMAAKAMSFFKPATNAVADTTQATLLRLTVPRKSNVTSIHSGLVIDQNYEPGQGYSLIIQHPNDFISRYSQMSDVFVRKGDRIKRGQAIGLSSTRPQTPLGVEIWHKGTAARPAQLLGY